MSGSGTYQTWQDLVADEDRVAGAGVGATLQDQSGSLDLADIKLPEEITALMQEREALEQKLNAITGKSQVEVDPDARRNLMYPQPVHTTDTRVEDRRLARLDEENRMALQHALERRRIARRQAEADELAKQMAEKQQRTALAVQRKIAAEAESAHELAQNEQLAMLAMARKTAAQQQLEKEQAQRRLAENQILKRAEKDAERLEAERLARANQQNRIAARNLELLAKQEQERVEASIRTRKIIDSQHAEKAQKEAEHAQQRQLMHRISASKIAAKQAAELELIREENARKLLAQKAIEREQQQQALEAEAAVTRRLLATKAIETARAEKARDQQRRKLEAAKLVARLDQQPKPNWRKPEPRVVDFAAKPPARSIMEIRSGNIADDNRRAKQNAELRSRHCAAKALEDKQNRQNEALRQRKNQERLDQISA